MLKRDYPTQYCSVASTLEIIGERWTLLIVRDIFLGVRRFDDLQRNLGIARNILQNRLERLVDEGIVVKRPYQERPVRYEYRLTTKGADLWPVLVSLVYWGNQYALGGDLDDRRRCTVCGADVSVTEAVSIRTGARRTEGSTAGKAEGAEGTEDTGAERSATEAGILG
jgi:DNA-binding HxlR family transcriptional regulator